MSALNSGGEAVKCKYTMLNKTARVIGRGRVKGKNVSLVGNDFASGVLFNRRIL